MENFLCARDESDVAWADLMCTKNRYAHASFDPRVWETSLNQQPCTPLSSTRRGPSCMECLQVALLSCGSCAIPTSPQNDDGNNAKPATPSADFLRIGPIHLLARCSHYKIGSQAFLVLRPRRLSQIQMRQWTRIWGSCSTSLNSPFPGKSGEARRI